MVITTSWSPEAYVIIARIWGNSFLIHVLSTNRDNGDSHKSDVFQALMFVLHPNVLMKKSHFLCLLVFF